MYDKFFVGQDLTSAENKGKQPPISRVTLMLDNENSMTAGDDTGIELVASCPHATQAMVNAILAQVKGKQYKMYSAENANIDPSAELGDGVTVDGIYSVISRIDDDGSGYAGLSAPGESELENEYPSVGPITRSFNLQIAKTRSQILKTAESITLSVKNEIEGLDSKIEQTAESLIAQITAANGDISSLQQTASSLQSQITATNGNVSSIEQYVNSITLSVSNGSTSSTISLKAGNTTIDSENITFSGFATFSGLSSGTTTINGACIKTGTIEANRINLSGAITWSSLSESVQNDINGAYNYAETAYDYANDALDAAEAIANGEYSGTFINGTTIYSPTIYTNNFGIHSNGSAGGTFNLYDGSFNMFKLSYDRDGEVIFSSPAGAICLFMFGSTSFYNNVNFWGKVHFGGEVTGISALTLNSSSTNKSEYQIELMSETSENTTKDIDIKDENGSLKIELPNATWYLDETGWHQ